MLIKRLAHICLGAVDLPKTIDFYCRLLGCRIVHEFRNPRGELYGVFLLVNNGTFLEFFQETAPKPPGGAFRHLCFEVEDINQAGESLRQAGFEVKIDRGKTDGALQCWVKDPDGNQVEFHQYDQKSVQYKHL
jgi:catechol 2,3-dioxygenase-like lactoylglutathione lyase family enzyme